MFHFGRMWFGDLAWAAKIAAVAALGASAVGALAVLPVSAAAASRTSPGGRELRTSPQGVTIDPAPSVTINTQARDGTGISIEGPTPEFDAFYPGDPGKWLHIVVLNRADLALVSNTSYDCPQATEHPLPGDVGPLKPCIDKVKADLAKLENRDHTNLVIATSQYDGKNADGQPPVGMSAALGPSLGIAPWDWWRSDYRVLRGTYSAVGIPGQKKLGSEMIGEQAGPGSGSLLDNLVRDNEGSYGLVPGEQVEFDTQAQGSDAKTNVIRVGDKLYRYEEPPQNMNGFMVLIVDAQTLEAKQYFFHAADYEKMTATLRAVNSAAGPFGRPKLVIVASRGELRDGRDVPPLADQLTADGGTRTRFMDAIWRSKVNAPYSYTLVGETGLGPGRGLEAIGGPKSGSDLNTVPLRGTLARTGRYYAFTTQGADNAFSQTARGDVFTGATQLLQTVGITQDDWPDNGYPERTAAVQYLGEQVLGTKDPRTQYWTIPWNADKWDTISAEIAGQSYPSTKAFGPKAFSWAKTELEQEIYWLNSEHEYLDDRAKPFNEATLKSWAELQTIATEIDKEVKAPDQTTKAQAAAVVDFAVDLGKEVPLVGKAIAAEVAMYKLATEYATIGGEPVEDPYPVKAAKVGKALVDRMTAAEHYLSTEVPEVISSNYEKLKIVGSCGSPLVREQAACPFKASDWQYTSLDQTHAGEGLLRGSEVAAYGALLPAKYGAWRLPVSRHKEANKKYAGRVFLQCFYPFADEPGSGQVAVPQSAFENDADYQITALGYLTGQGTLKERWEMNVPRTSITNPLFGSGSGELEVNKEEFFSQFFPSPDPLAHYPERDTVTGWDLNLCQ